MNLPLEQLLQAANDRPQDARVHFELGNGWASQGRYAEAAESFRRVVALRPDVAAAHFNLANALLSLEQWEEAARALEACVALGPAPDALENLALAYVQCDKVEQAIDSLRHALRLHPESLTACLRLARLLVARESYDEPQRLLQAALTRAPNHPQLRAEWAQLHQAKGDVWAAIEAWGAAIELDPDQSEWRCYRGALLQLVGQKDEARRVVDEGLARNPDDPRLLAFIDACLTANG